MKKRFGKIAAGIAIAGTLVGMCPAALSPITAVANETSAAHTASLGSGRETADTYKINVINNYTYTDGQEEHNEKPGGVYADKEAAGFGETVTVSKNKNGGGVPEGRVKVIRNDSGEDVTEKVLGEHHSHFKGDESFSFDMPAYDITIKADVIIGPYESTPVIAFSDDPDYSLASVVQSPNGTVSVSADTLTPSDHDEKILLAKKGDTLKLTATPDPGYVFKKWYIKCGICNVAMTDDLDIHTTIDNATGVATATLVQDESIWIQAVFEDGAKTMAPQTSIGIPLHISYVDENGNDITDKIRYNVLGADGKVSDDFSAENNVFQPSFLVTPTDKTVYDGDIDGRPVYRVIYAGSYEQQTNVIKTESLPEQYEPIDDINITTILGDVNDKEGLGNTTVVNADSGKVKIEKTDDPEGFYYKVIISVDTKKETEAPKNTENKAGQKDTSADDDKKETNNTEGFASSDKAVKISQSENGKALSSGYVTSDKATPVLTQPVKTTAPATGDVNNTAVYIIAAGVSITAVAFILVKKAFLKK